MCGARDSDAFRLLSLAVRLMKILHENQIRTFRKKLYRYMAFYQFFATPLLLA